MLLQIFHSFLWLSNIPLSVCTTSLTSLAAQMVKDLPGMQETRV